MKRQSGFSALEALVALAIITIALLPLLSLQTQVTRDHGVQRALFARAAATENALELVRAINPSAERTGSMPLGDQTLRWSSRPISRETRSTRQGEGEGEFAVRLYRLDVTVTAPGGAVVANFEVDALGWRRI